MDGLVIPQRNDVVAGRGGGSNNHPGNVPFWQKILENRESYKESRNNEEKAALAKEIFDSVNETGRFLEKEKKTGLWFEQPEEDAISKVKQALRDKYRPLWARDGREFCKEICEGKHFYPVDDEPKNFMQELQDTYIPNRVPGEFFMS